MYSKCPKCKSKKRSSFNTERKSRTINVLFKIRSVFYTECYRVCFTCGTEFENYCELETYV